MVKVKLERWETSSTYMPFIFFGEQQLELGTDNEGDLMQLKKEILYEV